MTRKDEYNQRTGSSRLTSSKQKKNSASKLAASAKEGLPAGLAQPALRALAAAGYLSVDRLANVREEDLLALHGMGPKAIEIIRAALKARGQTFLS
jgi:hypothetical protein